MAYYVMLGTKKEHYLNIPKCFGKKGVPCYKKEFKYSLDEIDGFTMQFNNENEMREYLVAKGIIPIENRKEKIILASKFKEYYYPVSIIYSECGEYLNKEYLFNVLRKKIKDKEFLESLVEHYTHKHKSDNSYNNNIKMTLNDIKEKLENNMELNNNIEYYFQKFIEAKLYNDKHKIGYSAFRDLAIYVYSYDKKHKTIEQEQKVNESSKYSIAEKYKPYRKIRKKEVEVGENYSLFS